MRVGGGGVVPASLSDKIGVLSLIVLLLIPYIILASFITVKLVKRRQDFFQGGAHCLYVNDQIFND